MRATRFLEMTRVDMQATQVFRIILNVENRTIFCDNNLDVIPAMETDLTDTLRDMPWIVGLIDTRTKKLNRTKTYRKRQK